MVHPGFAFPVLPAFKEAAVWTELALDYEVLQFVIEGGFLHEIKLQRKCHEIHLQTKHKFLGLYITYILNSHEEEDIAYIYLLVVLYIFIRQVHYG